MAARNEQATLLGIPVELRLKIYDYCLFHDDIGVAIKDIRHTTGSNGTQAGLIPNPGLKLHRQIPWLNLQSTCHFIHSELKSYMTRSKGKEYRTYVLDLDVYCNKPPVKSNRLVIWRGLPCPPPMAEHLIINVAARQGEGPWTEGGAASLARAVYQLLNQLFHNGPQLVNGKQLTNHMRVRDLTINVDIGTERNPAEIGCNTMPIHNFQLFTSGWEQISKMGTLVNHLEKTRLCSTGELISEKDIMVEYKTVPMIPGFWRGYGFEWGV